MLGWSRDPKWSPRHDSGLKVVRLHANTERPALSEQAGCELFFEVREPPCTPGPSNFAVQAMPLAVLSDEEAARGVVTHSSGNHGGLAPGRPAARHSVPRRGAPRHHQAQSRSHDARGCSTALV